MWVMSEKTSNKKIDYYKIIHFVCLQRKSSGRKKVVFTVENM